MLTFSGSHCSLPVCPGLHVWMRDQFTCLYLFWAAVKHSRAAGGDLWKHTLQGSNPTSAFKLPLHPSWTILHLQDGRGILLTSFQLPDVAPLPITSYSGCKNFTIRLLSGRSKDISDTSQVFLALCNAPDRSAPFVFICTVIWLVSNYSQVHADGSTAILRSPFVPQVVFVFSENDCFI